MNSFAGVSMLAIVCALAALHQSVAILEDYKCPLASSSFGSSLALSDKIDYSCLEKGLAELNKKENSEMKEVYGKIVAQNEKESMYRVAAAVSINNCPYTMKYVQPPKYCCYLIPITYAVCDNKECKEACCNMGCDYWYRCRQDHYVSKWTIKICWEPFSITCTYVCVPTQCNCYRTKCGGSYSLFDNNCC